MQKVADSIPPRRLARWRPPVRSGHGGEGEPGRPARGVLSRTNSRAAGGCGGNRHDRAGDRVGREQGVRLQLRAQAVGFVSGGGAEVGSGGARAHARLVVGRPSGTRACFSSYRAPTPWAEPGRPCQAEAASRHLRLRLTLVASFDLNVFYGVSGRGRATSPYGWMAVCWLATHCQRPPGIRTQVSVQRSRMSTLWSPTMPLPDHRPVAMAMWS